jgi:DNA polymerase elongation subunit (family B)
MGRIKNMKSRIRLIENRIKKVHPYDEYAVNIQGRVIMDMYPVLVRHDSRSNGRGHFTLSAVAKRYLNRSEAKQDVHYTEINDLQHGDPSTRKRLAEYCLQDSMIPFLLLFEPTPCRSDVVRLMELYMRRSHIGGNLLRYLFNKSMSYNDYFKQVRVVCNNINIQLNDCGSFTLFF